MHWCGNCLQRFNTLVVGFYHTIHLSIHPSNCSASLSFFPFLRLISVPCFPIPSFIWTSVLHFSISCLTPSSVHLPILDLFSSLLHVFILTTTSPNELGQKERKKKKELNYLEHLTHFEWHAELNPYPWARRHCPLHKLVIHCWYSTLCTHTQLSWNIFQPNSCLLAFKDYSIVGLVLSCLSSDVPHHIGTKTVFLHCHSLLSYVTAGWPPWVLAHDLFFYIWERCLPLACVKNA